MNNNVSNSNGGVAISRDSEATNYQPARMPPGLGVAKSGVPRPCMQFNPRVPPIAYRDPLGSHRSDGPTRKIRFAPCCPSRTCHNQGSKHQA